MNATTITPTLSARVASGVTAEYVRDLSRRSAAASAGARPARSDERARRHRIALPAFRRTHRVRGDAPAPRRPGGAARVR
jgi:hypothetical protein